MLPEYIDAAWQEHQYQIVLAVKIATMEEDLQRKQPEADAKELAE